MLSKSLNFFVSTFFINKIKNLESQNFSKHLVGDYRFTNHKKRESHVYLQSQFFQMTRVQYKYEHWNQFCSTLFSLFFPTFSLIETFLQMTQFLHFTFIFCFCFLLLLFALFCFWDSSWLLWARPEGHYGTFLRAESQGM